MSTILKKIFLIILPCLLLCSTVQAATPEDIETAISKGLTWLVTQQQPDGSWRYYEGFPECWTDVATTGLVLLKLVDRAKELKLDPFDTDPTSPTYYGYATNVIKGFDYIFNNIVSDANGIHLPCSEVYSTGISIMALASTNTPVRTITTGPLSGQTYQQALQGMMNCSNSR